MLEEHREMSSKTEEKIKEHGTFYLTKLSIDCQSKIKSFFRCESKSESFLQCTFLKNKQTKNLRITEVK